MHFIKEGGLIKIWGNDVDLGRKYMRVESHKPVGPLMESEAPCCGDGLSGNCLLIGRR